MRLIFYLLALLNVLACQQEEKVVVERQWLPIPSEPPNGTPAPLPEPQPGFLGRVWFEETLVQDAQSLSEADALDTFYVWNQRFNEGATLDELARNQSGVMLGLNSVSNDPQLGTIVPVGNTGAIYRVELRDFGQTRQRWTNVIEPNLDIPALVDSVRAAQLRFLLQKRVPWVYASDLLNTVFKANVYPILIEQPGLSKLDVFFRTLGVDRQAEFDAERAYCNGIDDSTITNQKPRTVCFYEGTFGTIWSTQDSDVNGDNPFVNPFPDFSNGGDRIYKHDAQEHRYRLPNGLWGHRLNNAERIDGGEFQAAAPTSVVFNIKQAAIGLAPDIDYLACHGCHINGQTLVLKDDLGPRIQADSSFNGAEKQLGREIFRFEKIQERVALDNQITNTAIQFMGIGAGEDPINSDIVNPFRLQQNLSQISAYFFERPENFARILRGTNTAAGQVGNLLNDGGSIGNETFIGAFFNIGDETNLFRDL